MANYTQPDRRKNTLYLGTTFIFLNTLIAEKPAEEKSAKLHKTASESARRTVIGVPGSKQTVGQEKA